MKKSPEGFFTRTPELGDADEVAALISACALSGGTEANTTAEEVRDDWQDTDLAEEAVAVVASDGRIAGYADLINRSYVAISVYGYVHPDSREQGIGAYLAAWGEGWTRDRIPLAPEDARVSVQHYINAPNTGARSLLEGFDYRPVLSTYVMEIRLQDAPPPRGQKG